VQLMCTQYVSIVNSGCHIGYPRFVDKTCENSEVGKWKECKECKGYKNRSALCRLHVCSVQCRW